MKIKKMREEKINIVIVDSGVDASHMQFAGISVKGCTFYSGVLSDGFPNDMDALVDVIIDFFA